MVTTLLSEVKLILAPPLTPLTVVPDNMGSAPAAAPTVSEFSLPVKCGSVMVTSLQSEFQVIPVSRSMPLKVVPDNIDCAPVVVPTVSEFCLLSTDAIVAYWLLSTALFKSIRRHI